MAGENRTQADLLELSAELQRAPFSFDLFHALRRLERAYRDKPRLGESLRPTDDPVRLGQEPTLIFAPSTLSRFEPGTAERLPRLFVYFFGLFGPNGPLPLHLTDYARDRERNAGDHTFSRFADLFHHRLLSLFHRAWVRTTPAASFDRPETDRFSYYVGATFGMGSPALRDRDALPDLAKLFHAGALAGQTRNPEGLRSMVSDFFRMPADVVEFVGHWIQIPKDGLQLLGRSPRTGALGVSAVLGNRAFDRQGKFRIVLGPVGYAEFRRMLPGGESLRRLVALVRNFAGEQFQWDLRVVLKKEQVPSLKLGEGGQLGWTTWVLSRPARKDSDDLLLDAVARAG